jgi:hypothetical protein
VRRRRFRHPFPFAWLAGGLLSLIAAVPRVLRDFVYRDVEGFHHAWRGFTLPVWIDDDGLPWLALTELRRKLPQLPRSATLRRVLPGGLRDGPNRWGESARADDLLALLARAQDPDTRAFCRWLDREVLFPARRGAQMRRDSAAAGRTADPDGDRGGDHGANSTQAPAADPDANNDASTDAGADAGADTRAARAARADHR